MSLPEYIVRERIEQQYDDSKKGDDWYFCKGCSHHLHEDDLLENDGYCPGCDNLADVQSRIRGGI